MQASSTLAPIADMAKKAVYKGWGAPATKKSVDGEELVGQYFVEGDLGECCITRTGNHEGACVLWYRPVGSEQEECSSVEEVRTWAQTAPIDRTRIIHQAETPKVKSSNSTAPSDLIGRQVRKQFGEKWYQGRVTKHDVSTNDEVIWHVRYEDGDNEDYNLSELEVILLSGDVPSEPPPCDNSSIFTPPVAQKSHLEKKLTLPQVSTPIVECMYCRMC
jgi:hypothetical protein